MAAPFRSPSVAAALGALLLTACAPGANQGHAAVADGLRFDYALGAPAPAAPRTYPLSLKISDAATGARVDDATVAVAVFGPGYDGTDLVNLTHDGQTYQGQVVMPKPAGYRLTFQVNRKPPATSAVAVFDTHPPA